jgi:small GTP-binding protein
MLYRFLTEHDAQIVQAERSQLLALRQPLSALDAPAEDLALLERALLQIDELFLLVVVGEFNAGKSAFINALLGRRLLTEGVTPTTTAITLLKYGDTQPAETTQGDGVAVITYPLDWLRDINIVDTPGTNAIMRRHQQLTEDFVPRADLILFITSADRPFSESERVFLQRIREWGKKVTVVVNKIDILESAEDVERVLAFIETNGRELLGRHPTIFPISARLARVAKETIDADERTRLQAASRFEALEDHILRALDERQRFKLKLTNPLGVARRLAARYLEIAQARRALLREDVTTTRTVEAQIAAYQAGLRRDFKYHLSHVDNVLYAMAERGARFFDETIRLSRIFDLANAERIQGMFERAVVADTAAQIEAHTQDVIDWMVSQDFKQWQEITEYLRRRAAHHGDRMIGQVASQPGFEASRRALLDSVGRAARAAVATYDRDAEARALAGSLQDAVARTALVEAGAIGLGALLVQMLTTTLLDVTGLLAAGTVAVLGLYVIPAKRRRARAELRAKIAALRAQLDQTLTDQFERELSRSMQRIRDAVQPYTRFVDAQQILAAQVESELNNSIRSLDELAEQIGQI